MKAKKTTLSRRIIGFATILIPARTLRTTGITVRKNSNRKSHIMTNNGTGRPSWKFRLFTNSRIRNGNTRIRLTIAGDLRIVKMFFIAFPSVIINPCSLIIPMTVSTNIQHTKLNSSCSMRRFCSLKRSLNVCSIDSANCSLNLRGYRARSFL